MNAIVSATNESGAACPGIFPRRLEFEFQFNIRMLKLKTARM